MKAMLSEPRNAGFTMTELITVMSIVAILTTIGVPSFQYVTTSNRMAAEINALLGDMQFARSEAIKEGQTVTLCSSADAQTCIGAVGGAIWNKGWIVFRDPNNDRVATPTAILRAQPGFTSTDIFEDPSQVFSAATYNREGYAPIGAAITMTLHSTSGPQWTRCLAVNAMGAPTTERPGPGDPACT